MIAAFRQSTTPEGAAYAESVLSKLVESGQAVVIAADQRTSYPAVWFWYRNQRWAIPSGTPGGFQIDTELGWHWYPTYPIPPMLVVSEPTTAEVEERLSKPTARQSGCGCGGKRVEGPGAIAAATAAPMQTATATRTVEKESGPSLWWLVALFFLFTRD